MTHATIPPMLHHRRVAGSGRPWRRRASILAGLVLVIAACGPTGPTGSPASSPSPSTAPTGSPVPNPTASAAATPVVDPATVYRTIEDQVVAIRGLQPKAAVSPTVLDDAGIKKLITDSFGKDNPPALMAANERIM
jgi:hypothetical protein